MSLLPIPPSLWPARRWPPLLSALALLGGCATYQPRDVSPASTQTQFDQRRLNDPGLAVFLASHQLPATGEWDLARLTLAAFYFNAELEVARAQLAEAEAGVQTAAARPNPTFTFTPGQSENTTGGITPWILGYVLDLPVELAGKRGYRMAGAQHRAEAARFDLALRAWTARNAVRRALTELHGAESAAEHWRRQSPLLERAAQLIEAQVKAGDISPLQAAPARLAVNRATLAVRESERAAATARSRLAEAVGIPLAALGEARMSFTGLTDTAGPLASVEARTWAAQNRADLLAALATYAAAQSALQGEIARQYPDLKVGPGYQFDQGEGKWSVGLGFELPVFHRNQGPIAAAVARRQTEAARFLALQHRVLAEVDRAMADYLSAGAEWEAVAAMRTTLERQATLTRAQLAAGETSRLELIRAEIELADQTRIEIDTRLRLARSVAALEAAVQRPLAWPETAWRNPTRTATAL